MTEDKKKSIFETLSPEEYAKAKVPTKEQFRAALRKGAEELREARRYNNGYRRHRCPKCNHQF